ncbi:MAG TPA: App1 family protein [Pyrinomonadaceae bacterium]|jgi:hypothetical protein
MANDFLKKVGGLVDAAKGKATQVIGAVADEFRRDKEVIPYPTYGYQKKGDPGTWVVPLRVWVSKARRIPISNEVVGVFVPDMGGLGADDIERLRARIKHFVADDDSGEAVQLKFDDDPEGLTYDLPGRTDFNGLIQHDLEIPASKAAELLEAQGSTSGWLTLTAAAEGFEGKGRVRLVEPRGLSIVSDIDDTIKISEIPAGRRIVLRNTFLRDYAAVPDMAEKYRGFGSQVMFHYVSGSPWQLYKLLDEFLMRASNFPEGAFHMKDVRKNLLTPESWQDFKHFTEGDEATLAQKVGQITRLFVNLPDRDFILIGDSGEKDPEVFAEIRKTFGERVREIIIRDVVNERGKPDSIRLKGMTILEAPTVVHGVTQFQD